ncbi:MAG: TrmB family transcriptional regulator [Nitrososphaera sp.]|uniref:TrmB family transcriptional regulator n=1 Tax=Nitrososphaera sp. TaxID=1971748 RepID=UPI003D6E46DA
MATIPGQAERFLQKFGLPPDDPLVASYDMLMEDLHELGLNAKEAKILMYLVVRKHSTAADISRHNDIGRTEAYNFISGLVKKGIVFSTFDRPQKYYALPLGQALDHLIESHRVVLERLEASKKQYCEEMDRISSSMVVSSPEETGSYQVLSGENSINSAIRRMISCAQKELVFFVSEKTCSSLYHAGLIDDVIGAAGKSIAVHLHTPCERVSEFFAGASKKSLAIKTISATATDFILVDNREIVVVMQSEKADKAKLQGFYTNNAPIISVFRTFFDRTT